MNNETYKILEKNTILGIVIGICITVTVFHIWYLYKASSRITALENFAVQVANIINQASRPNK